MKLQFSSIYDWLFVLKLTNFHKILTIYHLLIIRRSKKYPKKPRKYFTGVGWKRGGAVASPKDIKHARRTRHIFFLLFHFVIYKNVIFQGRVRPDTLLDPRMLILFLYSMIVLNLMECMYCITDHTVFITLFMNIAYNVLLQCINQ